MYREIVVSSEEQLTFNGNYKISSFVKCCIILSVVLNIITISCISYLFIITNRVNEKFHESDIHFNILDGEIEQVIDRAKYKGFSYYDYGISMPIGWNLIKFRILEYNTFGDITYNTATGLFIAPFDGFYRFTIFGFISSQTNSVDSRIGFALNVNSVFKYVGGCQLSAINSPIPAYTTTAYLKRNDQVNTLIFSPQPIIIGIDDSGYHIFFQVQFLQNQ